MLPLSGDPNDFPFETWTEKAKRKFNENPWVPLGCLATCGALVMSAIKMHSGRSKEMNYWLRARVVLQGVTLVALVGGSLEIQRQRNLQKENAGIEDVPRNEGNVELLREGKKEAERREFEERMKDAEAAHEEEMAVRRLTSVKVKQAVAASGAGASVPSTTTTSVPAEKVPMGEEKKSRWRFW